MDYAGQTAATFPAAEDFQIGKGLLRESARARELTALTEHRPPRGQLRGVAFHFFCEVFFVPGEQAFGVAEDFFLGAAEEDDEDLGAIVLGACDEAFSTLDGEAALETVEVGGAVPEQHVGVFEQDGASIAVTERNHFLCGKVPDEGNAIGVVGDDGGVPRGGVLARQIEAVRVEEDRVFGAQATSAGVHARDEISIGSIGRIGECAGGVVCATDEHGAEEIEPSVAGARDETEFSRGLELVPDCDLHVALEASFGNDFHGGEELLCAGNGQGLVGIFFINGLA